MKKYIIINVWKPYRSFLYILNFLNLILCTRVYIHRSAMMIVEVNNKNIEIILWSTEYRWVSQWWQWPSHGKKKRRAWKEPQRPISKDRTFSLGDGTGDFTWGNPGNTNESFQSNRVGESARDELFSPVLHDEADGFAETDGRPVMQEGIAITLQLDCRLVAVCSGTMVPYDGTAACRRAHSCAHS